MPKQPAKNWYWEAEHDKIAADEMLRLVRSPEGWPAEGLECIGLWFLLMNQMWRSVRVGYLCDPVQSDVPLKLQDLSSLTGRTNEVVQRVLQVLLDRNFFSKTPEGIIYSRGIIRKDSLRKKRAKAGRKGGKVLQVLLKQNTKQNTKQTLGIDIGIQSKTPLNGSAKNEADLFDEFWEAYPRFRRSAKGQAQKAWRLACTKHPPEEIVAALKEYAASPVGQSEYVKAPATWLNSECWLDDRQSWQRGSTKPQIFDSLKGFVGKGGVE